MKIKSVWRRSFESGNHRPYAALLYMGYEKMPSYFWENAVIYANGEYNRITAMYRTSGNSVLIIYE